MWTRQLGWIDPMEAARRLAFLPRLSFLDSAMRHPTFGRYSYLAADPFGRFTAERGASFWNGEREDDVGDSLSALRRRLDRYRTQPLGGLPPFQGGAIGAFAYELGWQLEGRMPPARPCMPDVDLAFYDVVLAFDHLSHDCWLVSSGHPADSIDERRLRAAARLDAFERHLATPAPTPCAAPHLVWRPTISRDAFRAGVERVRDYIGAGDIYQANIAQRFVATLPAQTEPLALYAALRAANPAPFGAYLAQGERLVMSTSPELFLRSDGRQVETRPIKGTARRHADAAADRDAVRTLLASPKDRAENIMIVDLLRNDLSRVCTPDSVDVPTLCALESYAGLHHLVSAVIGDLRPDRDVLDLLAAAFPGGSITGAPKLRAMEIIGEIEGRSRGIYCGAIGALGFDGSLDLAIAIRTLVVEGGAAELRVGGGITMLSDPDTEYEETLTKALRIFDAVAPTGQPTRMPKEAPEEASA